MALITKFVVILIDDNDPRICDVQNPGLHNTYIEAAEHYKEMKKYHPNSYYRIGTISWNETPNRGYIPMPNEPYKENNDGY